jgi:hypothetical protein
MKRSKIRIGLVAMMGVAVLAFAGAAFAESWSNVSLVDANCSNKVKADPDSHPRSCAIKCAGNGYGVWTADGKYLKFDAAGSEKALALLKATEQVDHLRVDVTGTLDGETLKVETIALTKPAA